MIRRSRSLKVASSPRPPTLPNRGKLSVHFLLIKLDHAKPLNDCFIALDVIGSRSLLHLFSEVSLSGGLQFRDDRLQQLLVGCATPPILCFEHLSCWRERVYSTGAQELTQDLGMCQQALEERLLIAGAFRREGREAIRLGIDPRLECIGAAKAT